MESEGGSWDFDIELEVGIGNAAIPASILYLILPQNE